MVMEYCQNQGRAMASLFSSGTVSVEDVPGFPSDY